MRLRHLGILIVLALLATAIIASPASAEQPPIKQLKQQLRQAKEKRQRARQRQRLAVVNLAGARELRAATDPSTITATPLDPDAAPLDPAAPTLMIPPGMDQALAAALLADGVVSDEEVAALQARVVKLRAMTERWSDKVKRLAKRVRLRVQIQKWNSRGQWRPLIEIAARKYGVSAAGLYRLMMLESTGQRRVVSGPYHGLWSRYRQLRTVSNESAGEPSVVLTDISPRTVEIPLPKPEPVKAVSEPKPAESPKPVEPVVGLPISPVPVAQALPAPSAVKETPVQIPPAPPAAEAVSVADRTALEAAELLGKAIADKNAGRIIEARNRLNKAMDLKMSEAVAVEVKKQLAGLSTQWLFSRDVLVGDTLCGLYEVQPGEKLSLIAKRYKVPYEMLAKLNNISRPELLQAGSKIKILYGPFNAVIRRSTFVMDLYLQGTFVKSYRVGLGRDKYQTPTGKWLVANGGKLIKPTWTDPDTGRRYIADDPDYPLGSRWISLEGLEGAARGRTGFAIHGTKDPQTIGTQSSRGCIRLFNGDAIEVYDLFEPGFSEVLVIE